jgi:hypothetical protein
MESVGQGFVRRDRGDQFWYHWVLYEETFQPSKAIFDNRIQVFRLISFNSANS